MPETDVFHRSTLDRDAQVQATIYLRKPHVRPHVVPVCRKVVDLWLVQKYVQYMDGDREVIVPMDAVDHIIMEGA